MLVKQRNTKFGLDSYAHDGRYALSKFSQWDEEGDEDEDEDDEEYEVNEEETVNKKIAEYFISFHYERTKPFCVVLLVPNMCSLTVLDNNQTWPVWAWTCNFVNSELSLAILQNNIFVAWVK